jgi:hypothetical protein
VDTKALAEAAFAQADAVEHARDAGEPPPDLSFPTI